MAQQEPTAEVTIGTVISTRRWSDTHFEVYGRKDAPRFYTDVEQRQEIFVKDTQGRESRWYVSPDKVGFREGSNIVIVTGQESEEHPSLIHYVSNTDSGEEYSDPTPVNDGTSLLNGWGLAAVIAVVLFAIVAMLGPIGAKNAVKNQASTAQTVRPTQYDVRDCPFGKKLYPDYRNPSNKYDGCPVNAELNPHTKLCECPNSLSELTQRMQAKEDAREKARIEREAAKTTGWAAAGALVIALVVGFMRNRSINNRLEDLAQARREKYTRTLLDEAAKHGVKLEVVDLQKLLLRRS